MNNKALIKPLDDHSEMYVTASRSKIHPPCFGLIRIFKEEISADELAKHTLAIAQNPLGLGRRVEKPRLPGARARWVPSPIPPSIRMETEPHSPAELSRLVDAVISQRPDPARDTGWRQVSARTDDGGTMVITWMNHAFGDARSLFELILGDHADVTGLSDLLDDARELNNEPTSRPLWTSTRDELGDVMTRVRRGLQGSARLGRDAMLAPISSKNRDELALLGPAVRAMRPRPRSVGTLTSRRTATMARIDYNLWRTQARAHGGSSNTLFIAVLANLLRQARRARGDAPLDRLRILLPVDISMALDAMGVAPEDRPNNTVIASIVDLPGEQYYGDLEEVKQSIKTAIDTAVADMETTANATRPAGMVDAMNLMPNAITHRIAARVQTGFDGVASNVGEMFHQNKAGIANHVPHEMYLLAAPMRTDITGTFGFFEGRLTLSFMADPAKLGPGGALSDRVAAELERWEVTGDVW
ncbi:MAG: hypothetical protein JHC98_11510 [Thermoleophilaceae bacterium]|nr:hypothetical protein [Thermoleophilaceae bacterium]